MRLFLVAATFVLAVLPLSAQDAPRPAPAGSTLHTRTPETAQQPVSTLHARAHLVVLDVVVEDKSHNPVRGLKAEDFQLLEDGTPQHVRNFEEHYPASAGDATPAAFVPNLPRGTFTNYTPVPPNSAINVILIDALNTPQRDQSYLHDQLLKFAKSQPAGYPTAVFGLSSGLFMLQGVTSDPKVLLATLERKDLPKRSPLLEDSLRGTGDTTLTNLVASNPGGGSLAGAGIAQALANMQGFDNVVNTQRTESRADMTLEALNSIARYLAGIPGRKNLIWFSGAFPINPVPSATPAPSTTSPTASLLPGSVDSASAFSDFAGNEAEFRETTNLLTLSQVAVYPIDARGIFSFTGMDAANPGTQYARNSSASPGGPGSTTIAGNDLSDFTANTAAEHEVMSTMARDTGGRAYYNANSLAKSATEAMQSGSSYYTLTYTPSNSKWNQNFRKIKVDLEGKGYTLSYRRGYYADDPDTHYKHRESSPLAPAPLNPAAAAMARGAPTPTQILMSARVHPSTATTEMLLAPENILERPEDLHSLAPFRRYTIDCIAATQNFQATDLPDGRKHLRVEFVTFVYDRTGKRLNRVTTSLAADLTPENYAHILKSGLAVRQEVSVPAKQETFLRIGVHDLASNRVGAVEISSADLSGVPVAVPLAATK